MMEKEQDAFCFLVEELLPLYQEHSMEERTERVIREHLENCPSCQEKNKEIALMYRQDKTNGNICDVQLSVQEKEERGKFRALSKRFKRRRVRNACIGIFALIFLSMVYQICFHHVFMAGDSMSPAIQSGDNCLVSKVSYLTHSPRRGDIVMLWMDAVQEYDLYRIVGIPGDDIEIARGHLSVNGKINKRYEGIGATETYQKNPEDYRITVPEGQYFFLGDHFEVSYDSRYQKVGCVTGDDIIGKYILTSKLPHLGVSAESAEAAGESYE